MQSNYILALKKTTLNPLRHITSKQIAGMSPKKTCRAKSRALDNLDYLSLLGKAKTKRLQEQLLDIANRGQIEAILECIQNVHNGNVQIKDNICAKRLRRHSKLVRNLKKPKSSLKEIKRQLSQRGAGGFLKSLLPKALQRYMPKALQTADRVLTDYHLPIFQRVFAK